MNIYVGNLSSRTTESDVREVFAVFGEVISVTLMDNNYIGSGKPRYYGFVAMASRSERENAIANLNGKKLRNHPMLVKEALPLSLNEKVNEPPAKYGKHFNSKTRER